MAASNDNSPTIQSIANIVKQVEDLQSKKKNYIILGSVQYDTAEVIESGNKSTDDLVESIVQQTRTVYVVYNMPFDDGACECTLITYDTAKNFADQLLAMQSRHTLTKALKGMPYNIFANKPEYLRHQMDAIRREHHDIAGVRFEQSLMRGEKAIVQ